MPINSHMLLSKFLLDGFSHHMIVEHDGHKNKTKAIYYYDIESSETKECKINEFNTIYGYYDDINEKYLSVRESNIGNIICRLRNLKKGESIELTADDKKELKFAFQMLVLRNASLLSKFKKEHSNNIIDQLNVNDVITMHRENPEQIDMIFGNYAINILVNETSVNLILPYNGSYVIPTKTYGMMNIIPISNKIAITLDECKENSNMHIINDESFISMLNTIAYQEEKGLNKKCIIMKEKNDIEKVKMERV